MKIVQRLLLVVLLVAVPLSILHILSFRQERREERVEVSLRAQRIALRAASEQRRVVDGARQMLAALAQLPVVRERDAAGCSLIMSRMQAQYPTYVALGVADPSGQIWCTSLGTTTFVGDRDYFKRAVARRRFTTGGYVVGRARGWGTLNFTLPFDDASGKLAGVLIAGLNLDRLAAEIGQGDLPPRARLLIADAEGHVLVNLPNGGLIGSTLPNQFRPAFAARVSGTLAAPWLDGSDRIIGFVPPDLKQPRGLPFLIAVGIDRKAAMAPLYDRARSRLAVLISTVAGALLLSWWFAARFVRRPVHRLAETIRAWREGDSSARVGRLDPGSEFDELGRAFDLMADEVEEREKRLRDALESTTDSVIALDKDWVVTFINERARLRLQGYDLVGRSLWDVFPDVVEEPVGRGLRRAMEQRQPVTIPFEYKPLGGHFESNAFPLRGGGLALFIREVTEQHKAQEELRRLALRDPLTGLPNRTYGMEMARSRALQGDLAGMALLDLDSFKHVNDTLGHRAGDHILCEVADRLNSCIGDDGMVARLGGDEFVVLIYGDPHRRETVADRLIECVEERPFTAGGRSHEISASCGLVLVDMREGVNVDDLLADADLALYRAKEIGGGTRRTFEPADRESYEALRRLEEEVARAARLGQFELYYQPQIRLTDGSLAGAEALVRWCHPVRGLLPPCEFIDVLERSRQALTVGNRIIDEACRQAAFWRRRGATLRVSVNLFADQVRSGTLPETVRCALAAHGLPAHALEVEVTEKVALTDEEGVRRTLLALRDLGVSIAFDDFGTGFASLTALKAFPVDRLKIDRSFVTNLSGDEHDQAIVEAVLALSRTLNLEVIAEGVETREEEEYLRSRGCQEGQGFLYAAPMPAREFGRRILRIGRPAGQPVEDVAIGS